jgi:hypothetical protein
LPGEDLRSLAKIWIWPEVVVLIRVLRWSEPMGLGVSHAGSSK